MAQESKADLQTANKVEELKPQLAEEVKAVNTTDTDTDTDTEAEKAKTDAKGKLEAANAKLAELNSKLKTANAKFKDQSDKHAAELEAQAKEHTAAVKELNNKLDKAEKAKTEAANAKLEAQAKEHAVRLKELNNKLEAANAKLKGQSDKHAAELKAQSDKHAAELETQSDKHAAAVKDLQGKLEAAKESHLKATQFHANKVIALEKYKKELITAIFYEDSEMIKQVENISPEAVQELLAQQTKEKIDTAVKAVESDKINRKAEELQKSFALRNMLIGAFGILAIVDTIAYFSGRSTNIGAMLQGSASIGYSIYTHSGASRLVEMMSNSELGKNAYEYFIG